MEPLLNLNPLGPLNPLGESLKPGGQGPQALGQEGAFADVLKQALQEVSDAQGTADQEARNLMTGEGTDIHSAILAVQKADVSFQMMMAVRSKLIEAYREVMRMQM